MPYVEGFGTYPFGEEWLFEAVARSHLPVLDAADRLTMSMTPVLADQLEADGVGERMLTFLRRHRLEPAERDGADSEAGHYRRAIEALERSGGDPLAPFQTAGRSGSIELLPSAATHAVLPLLATREGRRLQLDAGLRSHHRRFGRPRGFWLPECAYSPGVESLLLERGLAYTCIDPGAAADEPPIPPLVLPGGVVGFAIDWPTVSLVWSDRGYPAHEDYLEYHRLSERGTRLWAISGRPYDAEAAAARARAHASDFLASVADRFGEPNQPGLCVFAIDTELLGHWWAEGPRWLAEVLAEAEGHGVRLLTLSQALERHPARERLLPVSSWGEGKSLETWDSPSVADLAWAARRLELRLVSGVQRRSLGAEAALRAARELLAVQSSDWAFMDFRGQAGDYPFSRATAHGQAMLEAIHSSRAPDPRMRNLAPDLVLAPLLET